jgi:hypothetical protein
MQNTASFPTKQNVIKSKNISQIQNDKQIIVTTPSNKVVIEPKYQTQPLQINESNLNFMQPSKIETYSIPAGTILYHGTKTVETFNPFNIKLSNSNLVAFFSPSKRFAADYIGGCADYKDNEKGFIHMFRVTKDIDKILIISTFDVKDKLINDIAEKNYCSSSNNYGIKFNGVGFFVPKKSIENRNKILFIPEFALCDPSEFLEYMNTQRCLSKHVISDIYRFDG